MTLTLIVPITQSWIEDEDLQKMYLKYQEWKAWYTADMAELANYYSRIAYTPTAQGWYDSFEARTHREELLHVPLAGDMASISANLLFSEPVKITSSSEANQKFLDDLVMNIGFQNLCIEGEEIKSGYGSLYAKIDIDPNLADHPILTLVTADMAIPVFGPGGYLKEIKFWKVINRDNGKITRKVETRGRGYILVEIYEGDDDNLGILKEVVEDESMSTGLDRILAYHIPNRRPNKIIPGSFLGVSDYCGLEPMLTALDQIYTNWMGEIEDGRGQVYITRNALINPESGRPYFDSKVRTYVVNSIEDKFIDHVQFEIRSDEYMKAANNLVSLIVSTAGYSLQSFGMNIGGNAESGTALNIRERKSLVTASAKQRTWKPIIAEIMYDMMLVSKSFFGAKITPEKPNVELGDSIPFNVNDVAQTINMLNAAGAASTETLVRMANPELSDEAVQEEVERIMKEKGIYKGVHPED